MERALRNPKVKSWLARRNGGVGQQTVEHRYPTRRKFPIQSKEYVTRLWKDTKRGSDCIFWLMFMAFLAHGVSFCVNAPVEEQFFVRVGV
jgi:hypothetical protein